MTLKASTEEIDWKLKTLLQKVNDAERTAELNRKDMWLAIVALFFVVLSILFANALQKK